MGLSYNNFDDEELGDEIEGLGPKFGVRWQIADWFSLRFASPTALKRALLADQTIEPTQVAGFNQFFDDISGTEISQYAVGVDAVIAENLYGGAEVVRRDLDVPLLDQASDTVVIEAQREDTYRSYLYWAPLPSWAASAEARYDRFKRKDPLSEIRRPIEVETISVPVKVHYFGRGGFFGQVGATYVHQHVARPPTATAASGREHFVVVDAAIGYRFPARRGIISFEVANLLDEHFSFQDENIQLVEPQTPRFIPDRRVLLRATLNF